MWIKILSSFVVLSSTVVFADTNCQQLCEPKTSVYDNVGTANIEVGRLMCVVHCENNNQLINTLKSIAKELIDARKT